MKTATYPAKNIAPTKRALCRAVAAACLIPTGLLAQDFTLDEPAKPPPDPEMVRELTEVLSELEFGIGLVSDDSFRFGKYTGLNEDGAYGLLDADIRRRGAYDGEDLTYWRLQAENLGLDSRYVKLEYGQQGDYKTYILYDQIPVFHTETASTPFNGAGGGVLSLPANWVAGTGTAGMTQLLPSLKPFDVEHDRKRLGIGFNKVVAPRWTVKTGYQYETKEGTKTIGGVIGNSGGNPRAVILPEPIDYKEHKFDAELNYTDKKQQFQLAYRLSLFGNDQDSLVWQNPYSAIGGWAPAAGYPTGQGELALPPDNEYQQISAFYGNNLSDTTRFTGDLAYGIMTQDEAFLPITVNPALGASIVNPLPRDSLDGKIEHLLLNLQISQRSTPKLHWKGQLRYEDRDNKTPRDAYNYIGGDSQFQDPALDGGRIRFNEPYSREELKLAVDGGYKVAQRTELTAGLEHQKIDRTFTEREEAEEDTLRLGLMSRMSEKASVHVRYQRAERDGSTYVGEEPFVSSNTPEEVAAVPGGWENLPGLRKFHLADRVRDKLNLVFNFMPAEMWNLGFGANYVSDDYKESEFGLTKSQIEEYTVDLAYIPDEHTSIYGFATVERLESDQDARAFSGTAKLTQSADPTRDWIALHRDDVDSVGFGFKHTLMNNKLDLGADYVYSKSKGRIDVLSGSSLTTEPLPNLNTELNSLSIYGKYRIKPNMHVRVRYWYEKYESDDWAVDNVAPDELANVITLGDSSPDYDVHFIGVSFVYRFK